MDTSGLEYFTDVLTLLIQVLALGFLIDAFRRFLKINWLSQLVSKVAISIHIIAFGLFFISSLIYIVMITVLLQSILNTQAKQVDMLFYSEWAVMYMLCFADFIFLYLLFVIASSFLSY